MKNPVKLRRAVAKLERAYMLCREAVALTLEGDPSSPAAHVPYQDELCGAPLAVGRALLFVRSRQ